MINKSIKDVIKTLFFLFIALLLLFFAFRGVDPKNLISRLSEVKLFWFFLSLFFALNEYLIRAYRWKIMMQTLGRSPAFLNTFYALMSAYLANYIIPRIGEISRCTAIHQTDKLPVDKVFGTVILERTIDFAFYLLLCLALIIFSPGLFGDFLSEQVLSPVWESLVELTQSYWFWIFLFLFILILIILVFSGKRKKGFLYKLRNIVKNVLEGIRSIRKLEKHLLFWVLSILIWINYFLMTWVLFYSLDITSHLKAVDGLFILIVGFLGIGVPVQGGIGTYHLLVTLALGIYGIGREDGLLFATLSHGSQSLLVLVLGLISFIALFINRKKAGNT